MELVWWRERGLIYSSNFPALWIFLKKAEKQAPAHYSDSCELAASMDCADLKMKLYLSGREQDLTIWKRTEVLTMSVRYLTHHARSNCQFQIS